MDKSSLKNYAEYYRSGLSMKEKLAIDRNIKQDKKEKA